MEISPGNIDSNHIRDAIRSNQSLLLSLFLGRDRNERGKKRQKYIKKKKALFFFLPGVQRRTVFSSHILFIIWSICNTEAMPNSIASLNTIDKLLSNDHIPNVNKLIELQHTLFLMPYIGDVDEVVKGLPFEKYEQDDEKSMILKLYQLQLHLYVGGNEIDYSRVEESFKWIQNNKLHITKLSNTSDNLALLYLKIKYNDVLTDYQYLFAPTVDEYKFIDFINKKLMIINSLPDEVEIQELVNEIKIKIIIAALLCGNDFRKRNIFNYIIESNFDIEKASIKNYFALSLSNKFIPFKLFEEFLHDVKDACVIFNRLSNKSFLINNYLENNISLLPNYYDSIYLSRINGLFHNIGLNELEDLIQQMITNNKLPPQTRIDQINGILLFNNDLNNSNKSFGMLNNHIKDVGDIINNISTSLDKS